MQASGGIDAAVGSRSLLSAESFFAAAFSTGSPAALLFARSPSEAEALTLLCSKAERPAALADPLKPSQWHLLLTEAPVVYET